MAINAILSKGVLIKGSIAAAGGAGLGVTWWQVYDNVRPKELAEEKGGEFVLSNFNDTTNRDLDDIPYLKFENSEKYRNVFRDGDCIKKYLPGKINDIEVQETISRKGNNNPFVLDAHSFSGRKINNKSGHRENVGFVGTQGCLSINIEYNNNVDAKKRGIMGRMELVAWNEPVKSENINVNGYGMIMSSIISNLKDQFKFINKLTFIKKNEKRNWDVLNSAIWVDTYSNKIGEDIKFRFGQDEFFSFTTSRENTSKMEDNAQKYRKLARWFLGKKGENHDKLLGHWNISIGKENTDLWKDLDSIKQNKIFSPELYYKSEDKKWYRDSKFKYDFGNFDRWNPAEQAGNHGGDGNNRMSEHGTWIDVLEECVNKKNSSYKNICLTVS